jgi:N-acetylglutamate synthase-like GNAT family acetyltransferase
MVEVIDFEPSFAKPFRELNEAWITKYFELEPEDITSLANPQQIVDKGGVILVAIYKGEAVGVCALNKMSNEKYEVSKFAVDETKQGLGIGNTILQAVVAKAKLIGAQLLYLEGNTKLSSSIHLYRKFGFKEMNLADYNSGYQRVDIIMELSLT